MKTKATVIYFSANKKFNGNYSTLHVFLARTADKQHIKALYKNTWNVLARNRPGFIRHHFRIWGIRQCFRGRPPRGLVFVTTSLIWPDTFWHNFLWHPAQKSHKTIMLLETLTLLQCLYIFYNKDSVYICVCSLYTSIYVLTDATTDLGNVFACRRTNRRKQNSSNFWVHAAT